MSTLPLAQQFAVLLIKLVCGCIRTGSVQPASDPSLSTFDGEIEFLLPFRKEDPCPPRDRIDPKSGEYTLMQVILEDAQKCLIPPKSRRGKEQYDATLTWLTSDDERWVFSFVSICDCLGLDPQWTRRRLLEEAGVPAEYAAGVRGAYQAH